jgi:hypothetical protein
MLAHIVDDFIYSRQQPGVIKNWLAYCDAVSTERLGFAE